MKNLYLLLAIALLVAGCKKKDALVPVRVCVDDFTITQEDFPSREDPTGIGDYSGVKAITLAFYTAGGDEQYEFTQGGQQRAVTAQPTHHTHRLALFCRSWYRLHN